TFAGVLACCGPSGSFDVRALESLLVDESDHPQFAPQDDDIPEDLVIGPSPRPVAVTAIASGAGAGRATLGCSRCCATTAGLLVARRPNVQRDRGRHGTPAAWPRAVASYVPRTAADTVLLGVVQEHLETFLATAAARTDGVGLPAHRARVPRLPPVGAARLWLSPRPVRRLRVRAPCAAVV